MAGYHAFRVVFPGKVACHTINTIDSLKGDSNHSLLDVPGGLQMAFIQVILVPHRCSIGCCSYRIHNPVGSPIREKAKLPSHILSLLIPLKYVPNPHMLRLKIFNFLVNYILAIGK